MLCKASGFRRRSPGRKLSGARPRRPARETCGWRLPESAQFLSVTEKYRDHLAAREQNDNLTFMGHRGTEGSRTPDGWQGQRPGRPRSYSASAALEPSDGDSGAPSRGPARGFPPAPGQPDPVYLQDDFDAWNDDTRRRRPGRPAPGPVACPGRGRALGRRARKPSGSPPGRTPGPGRATGAKPGAPASGPAARRRNGPAPARPASPAPIPVTGTRGSTGIRSTRTPSPGAKAAASGTHRTATGTRTANGTIPPIPPTMAATGTPDAPGYQGAPGYQDADGHPGGYDRGRLRHRRPGRHRGVGFSRLPGLPA